MPTYVFECKECKERQTKVAKMAELDTLKSTMYHCNQLMGTVIQVGLRFFARSPFNSNELWEHASDDPMSFSDKGHLKEHCEENGLISRYLEDGDVP
jgi:hypothetical protein